MLPQPSNMALPDVADFIDSIGQNRTKQCASKRSALLIQADQS
jgi:hypothetical protein